MNTSRIPTTKRPSTARTLSIALAAAAIAGSVTALADDDNQGPDTAIAQLYELQAAYHEAAGGAGIDAATKAKHLQEMLEIWTADGSLSSGAPSTWVGAIPIARPVRRDR
jgi:hypothetical protein